MGKRRISFEEARARFVHRFTMEHVPAWAFQTRPDGSFYAPQFATDREWYEATRFPGEPGIHGNSCHCFTGAPTWPMGDKLTAPFNPRVGS